ncbi:TPA: hypothetical protein QDC27_002253 [Burkholderia cepacia ATCC 25416]|uniref:hypothetical protein n=1 Tax=Burkholderia cepacia TaxID=292 RepID=UPI001CF31127|nr:hypothetical protein [Burkholderia cepacia]HDR9767294.1 hypothetical protein [Burkholderia cepacia ATCC 25416]MCA8076759.1 hypothetical protein [Burkholderia cepacia]HDR9774480.1 hypothetical protein [Burkholderia cepacia ATCC 25416]HDR9783498.1 hypothetical protein [Burkholderia cepacia ATCC 25416]HDR9791356.1 hypothetical protein [Burkholderia cepacia ATCC 25416]
MRALFICAQNRLRSLTAGMPVMLDLLNETERPTWLASPRHFARAVELNILNLEASSKRLLDTPEDIPTDRRATEFQECFVNVSPLLEASA